jgi:carbonic anhydrase
MKTIACIFLVTLCATMAMARMFFFSLSLCPVFETTNIFFFLFFFFLFFPFFFTTTETCPDWSYSGSNGPAFWGSLCADFATCGTGGEQSPINIPTESDVVTTPSGLLSKLKWEYIKYFDVEVVNTGHWLQINVPQTQEDPPVKAKQSELRGGRIHQLVHYDLASVQFHAPSEHMVDGLATEMELHYVHQREALGDSRGLNTVIVAVRYEILDGERAKQFDALVDLIGNGNLNAAGGSDILDTHDFALGMPSRRQYWTYDGSITSPDCSETVEWYVMDDIQVMGREEWDAITSTFLTNALDSNARPVQALGTRAIFVYPNTSATLLASMLLATVLFFSALLF